MTELVKLPQDAPQIILAGVILLLSFLLCYTAYLSLRRFRTFFFAESKTVFEVVGAVLGLIVAYLGADKDHPVITVVGIFVALIPFLVIERLETRTIRKDIKEQQVSIREHFDRIDTYLKAAKPDVLTVALFDDLLIYLPIYVAEQFGYFSQEGISIKYSTKFGDEQVAKAVAESEADIGLCDPCMCARAEFSQPGASLRILAPLVTNNAARPVTRHELRVRSNLVRNVEVTIVTYPAPSTTFVMAAALRDQLRHHSEARRQQSPIIKLKTIEVQRLNEDLENVLEANDVVMLWDPLLTRAKSWPETTELILDESPTKSIMCSAVVLPERLLKDKPTVALRLFRALSRASFAIHLAASGKPDLLGEVVRAANNRMSIPDGRNLSSLIQSMVRQELFPIIQNHSQLNESPEWRDYLHRALKHRSTALASYAEEFKKEQLATVQSAEECRKFFCPADVFIPVSNRGH